MSISAYLYVNRGEDYNFPYLQCINSVMWCDEIIVGTDSRFEDLTISKLMEFAKKQTKIKVVVEEFDFNNNNPQGKIKQLLREQCSGDWCLEMDADEVFDISKTQDIIQFCDEAQHRIYAVDLKAYNFFNGDWINTTMPGDRTMLTRNIKGLVHYIDDKTPNNSGRLGNNLIDLKGIKVNAGYRHKENMIFHYGWYSLSRKWEMKQTLHYYEGALRGLYDNLDEYTTNLDDENVSFWGLPTVNREEFYEHSILSEMEKANLKRFSGRHPDSMSEWMKDQQVVPWGGIGRSLKNMGSSLRGFLGSVFRNDRQ